MIDRYFSAPKTLRRLRSGLSGTYIDGFADALTRDGYGHATVVRYLRAAAHVGVFLERRHKTLADLDAETVRAFRRHLRRRRDRPPDCRSTRVDTGRCDRGQLADP